MTLEMLEKYKEEKKVIVLRSDKEAEKFLQGVMI
jgi:hypothetical protein